METFENIVNIEDKRKLKEHIKRYGVILDFNEKHGIIDDKLLEEYKILKEIYDKK